MKTMKKSEVGKLINDVNKPWMSANEVVHYILSDVGVQIIDDPTNEELLADAINDGLIANDSYMSAHYSGHYYDETPDLSESQKLAKYLDSIGVKAPENVEG